MSSMDGLSTCRIFVRSQLSRILVLALLRAASYRTMFGKRNAWQHHALVAFCHQNNPSTNFHVHSRVSLGCQMAMSSCCVGREVARKPTAIFRGCGWPKLTRAIWPKTRGNSGPRGFVSCAVSSPRLCSLLSTPISSPPPALTSHTSLLTQL